MFPVFPGSDTAEGKACSDGKASSKYRSTGIRTEGDKTSWPSNLYSCLHKLLGEPLPVILTRHKDIEGLLLELLSNFLGNIRAGSSTKNGSKTRSSTINKLNASLPEDDIIGST